MLLVNNCPHELTYFILNEMPLYAVGNRASRANSSTKLFPLSLSPYNERPCCPGPVSRKIIAKNIIGKLKDGDLEPLKKGGGGESFFIRCSCLANGFEAGSLKRINLERFFLIKKTRTVFRAQFYKKTREGAMENFTSWNVFLERFEDVSWNRWPNLRCHLSVSELALWTGEKRGNNGRRMVLASCVVSFPHRQTLICCDEKCNQFYYTEVWRPIGQLYVLFKIFLESRFFMKKFFFDYVCTSFPLFHLDILPLLLQSHSDHKISPIAIRRLNGL